MPLVCFNNIEKDTFSVCSNHPCENKFCEIFDQKEDGATVFSIIIDFLPISQRNKLYPQVLDIDPKTLFSRGITKNFSWSESFAYEWDEWHEFFNPNKLDALMYIMSIFASCLRETNDLQVLTIIGAYLEKIPEKLDLNLPQIDAAPSENNISETIENIITKQNAMRKSTDCSLEDAMFLATWALHSLNYIQNISEGKALFKFINRLRTRGIAGPWFMYVLLRNNPEIIEKLSTRVFQFLDQFQSSDYVQIKDILLLSIEYLNDEEKEKLFTANFEIIEKLFNRLNDPNAVDILISLSDYMNLSSKEMLNLFWIKQLKHLCENLDEKDVPNLLSRLLSKLSTEKINDLYEKQPTTLGHLCRYLNNPTVSSTLKDLFNKLSSDNIEKIWKDHPNLLNLLFTYCRKDNKVDEIIKPFLLKLPNEAKEMLKDDSTFMAQIDEHLDLSFTEDTELRAWLYPNPQIISDLDSD